MTNITVYPSAYPQPLGCFQRSSVNELCTREKKESISFHTWTTSSSLFSGTRPASNCPSLSKKICAVLAYSVNWDKSDRIPLQERVHLGFIVNFSEGLFKVSIAIWESLHTDINSILASHNGRVQTHKLASLVGTLILMKIAWSAVTQLYTRNLYHILNNVVSLN